MTIALTILDYLTKEKEMYFPLVQDHETLFWRFIHQFRHGGFYIAVTYDDTDTPVGKVFSDSTMRTLRYIIY